MHTGGYDFVSSHMCSRPPPICPIKGCVLLSLVSQSLALESSTSQNLTVTDTLDYALRHPHLDNNHHAFVSSFHSCCSRRIITHCIIITVLPGLSMTSCRLLSSTERKNHKCRHMISDATLVFRWFKFTLKPPNSRVHGNFFSAIWDTSHWNFFVKFRLKTPYDIS